MTQVVSRTFISHVDEKTSTYEQRSVEASYSLREYQAAGAYPSHHPDRQYEGSGWHIQQPRSPMSDGQTGLYEVSPSKVGDMYQARPDLVQKPPREQLPPLSSLFGSASQSRPGRTSYSDHHSPGYPVVSPTDARPGNPPVGADRPYDGSHFQRPPSSQQQSYPSRSEQAERLGFPIPPLPAQVGVRPKSPRYESRHGHAEPSRTGQPPALNGWSPRAESTHPEHFSRDTSSSFRPHLDQHGPHPTHGQRTEPERRSTFLDAPHTAPVTPSYPPTPASTVAGDSHTTKDGLGPKIWTGTQFLPRFVRQAEVPGEGLCYFYDDGTHCKTVIDGEIVNAHWGVTKAGKPRKRLAIACITCREKKIKCDPDYPRCVQCEKFGRICKFKNAPRGGQGSPDTPPADPEDVEPRPASSRADVELFGVGKLEHSHSVSPRQTLRQATPDSETHHSKRQRNGFNDFTPVPSEASPRHSVHENALPSNPWIEPPISSAIDHTLLRDWQVNPYTAQPLLTTELISIFFKDASDGLYRIFPEGVFKSWVLSTSEKTLDDLMLIYTILAFATVCSSKPEHKALGVHYAAISRYACDKSHVSIQLVQSRLILSVYYFSILNANDSWDFCGSALRTASVLKLNLEIEKSDDAFLQRFPYGLNRHGYAECRRRTFWICFLLDRFNGFGFGYLSIINPEDVFLRLPCDANSFELQAETKNPYFEVSSPPIQNLNWTIGSMAYLITSCSIWGDVMANIYRTSQRPFLSTSTSSFTAFYESTTQRLRSWKDALPSCYAFSPENVRRAAHAGEFGTFIMMHTVHHTTVMKLNRYVQLSSLTSLQLNHHNSVACQHAEAILRIMDALSGHLTPTSSVSGPTNPNERLGTSVKLSTPFVGYSIVSAVDVVTARFSLPSLPALLTSLSGAQSSLAELAISWQSAKNQQALVLQRVRDLTDLIPVKEEQSGGGATGFKFGKMNGTVGRDSGDGLFMMREPIEKVFSREFDCIYA